MEYQLTLRDRLKKVYDGVTQLRKFWSTFGEQASGVAGFYVYYISQEYESSSLAQEVIPTFPLFATAPRGVNRTMLTSHCRRIDAVLFANRMYYFLEKYRNTVGSVVSQLNNALFSRRFLGSPGHNLQEFNFIFSIENRALRKVSGALAVLLDTDVLIKQVKKALQAGLTFKGSLFVQRIGEKLRQARQNQSFGGKIEYSLNEAVEDMFDPVVVLAGAPFLYAEEIAALPNPISKQELLWTVRQMFDTQGLIVAHLEEMYNFQMAEEAFVTNPRRLEHLAQDMILQPGARAIHTTLSMAEPGYLRAEFRREKELAVRRLKELEDELDELKTLEAELSAMGAAFTNAGAGGAVDAAAFVPHVEHLARKSKHTGTLGGPAHRVRKY